MSAAGAKRGTAAFGIIGLGVMGQNLALNVERNGYPVVVWNREPEWVDEFVQRKAHGKRVIGTTSIQDFVGALARPRKIMMMIRAGAPVDWTIDQVKPYLEKGDIIIDGGNSRFQDTQRREKDMAVDGLRFVGTGVSGGETGARWGPSLMPGGTREAYEEIRPVFEAIAAQVDDGPCVTYIGPDGAGHFVKMVHNGIEYGDMQLIAEAYDILRHALGLGANQLGDIFAEWNAGMLNSYLIEITAKIFTVTDEETGKPLVDLILDAAGEKGTGRWTSAIGLELGVPIPTIHAAIEARMLSHAKAERVNASRQIAGPQQARFTGDRQELITGVHDALYASKICSYAQGMALIRAGSQAYRWGIDLGELSRIWKGGCIIRAQFLDKIKQAFRSRPDLPNVLLDPDFAAWVTEAQPRWRQTVAVGQSLGIPLMAMSASLAYFDTYRTANLPQNLTQAQRDFFGAHLYERTDKPEQGPIHTDWVGLTGESPVTSD
ncbi:MAG: decarboxylating NADP(+)-dependent phosphogluconate dehydrogenase [Candidatus Methylomirabilales bacterium]